MPCASSRRPQRFVGAASFAALTGAPVLVDEFERDPARGAFPDQAAPAHDPLSHLELVRNADAFLIAPATANTIAKLAHGLADNLLTSAALAATCPVLVAPAMNNHMYEHAPPATTSPSCASAGDRRGPRDRRAGSGTSGIGRLAEPAEPLDASSRGPRRRASLGWAEGARHGRRLAADRPVRFVGQTAAGPHGRAGRRGRRAPRSPSSPPTSAWPARPACATST
jgi:phosphopantothenoylcysteine decarboxylase/phosphopantothenate--cysteine ligase